MKRLKPLVYTPFTAEEIAPCGWLLQQLRIQAEGLSGNLHKVWPDIRDSKWIGGTREGWERVPYWLDGKDGNGFARHALELLQRDHGMANGHFTGDECLAGDSPIQGSECCSVVEAMYSYEWLIALTGDPYWQDMLEKLAYNALPATLSPDMWTHQYDQQTNQVQCTRLPEEGVIFRTNSGESHLFGLEPNFGCCTANFGQGFPKFALSCLMRTERGIAVTAIAPVRLWTVVHGVEIFCEVVTEYPFRDSLEIILTAKEPVTMELELRVPGFPGKARVNGQDVPMGKPCRFALEGVMEFQVSAVFEFETHFEKRPREMACVYRGPLLFALPVPEKWIPLQFVRDGVERKYPYCDYELLPQGNWNYGYWMRDRFIVETHPLGKYVFSPDAPPITVKTCLCEIDWRMENGVCKMEPESRAAMGEPREMTLIPYGCTNLRMTEMPFVQRGQR